jgi:hypothetical protein
LRNRKSSRPSCRWNFQYLDVVWLWDSAYIYDGQGMLWVDLLGSCSDSIITTKASQSCPKFPKTPRVHNCVSSQLRSDR